MKVDKIYIQRALDLAHIGHNVGASALNMGVVIVHHNRIIGESFFSIHDPFKAVQKAIERIHNTDRHLLKVATIYLSHLPSEFDRIFECGVKQYVSLAYSDNTFLEKSTQHSKEIELTLFPARLLQSSEAFNRIQDCRTKNQRPYIVLKYAQSEDGFIGRHEESVWLTNSFSKRLVHKWRGELDVIMVGTNTARMDNPALTNRFFPHLPHPLRIVLDRQNNLSRHLQLFDDEHPTWIITAHPSSDHDYQNIRFMQFDFTKDLLSKLLDKLHQANMTSLLVEGGAQLLRSFIEQNLWDEARIFTSPTQLSYGIPAPQFEGQHQQSIQIGQDRLDIFYRNA